MVLRDVLIFYLFNKKSCIFWGICGCDYKGKMSMDGFDLKLPTAFANQMWWHSANGSVLTSTPLCHCCGGVNRRKSGESVVGHEMSFCSSNPGG